MADFTDALDAALHGYYSPRADYISPLSSPRGFKARVRALEKEYGSKRAAAAAAGVGRDTWVRWTTKGRTPSAASVARVGTAHTALLRAVKVARKGHISKLSVKATVAATDAGTIPGRKRKSKRYNGGQPESGQAHRWFNADRLSTAQLRNISNAWAAGQTPDQVATLAKDEIASAYGSRFEFEGTNVTVEIN